MKYKIFILSFILLGNLSNIRAQGLIHNIKKTVISTNKRIAGVNVSYDGSNIIVRGLSFTRGIVGMNEYGYNGFSWEELDQFIYNIAVYKAHSNELIVLIYTKSKNIYGYEEISKKPIVIGPIDISECKKYKDFQSWNYWHKSRNMFEQVVSSSTPTITIKP